MDLEFVALTNDHATLSKVSAEKCGFFQEGSYSSQILSCEMKSRAPLINIGYTIRVKMIRHFLSQILSIIPPQRKVCIFSIGAGFDNTYHWFRDSFPHINFEFFDIDTDIVFSRKAKMLSNTYGYDVVRRGGYYAVNENYKLIPLDLKSIESRGSLLEGFKRPENFNIWISECVLCYLEREAADKVLKFASTFPNSFFILYEQLIEHPHDPFTKCMLAHFTKSNSPLLSSISVNGSDAQIKRFDDCGFSSANVTYMSEYLYNSCCFEDAQGIFDVQPFDEWEELDLFLSHYAVVNANNVGRETIGYSYGKDSEDGRYILPISLRNQTEYKPFDNNVKFKYSSSCVFENYILVSGGRQSLTKVSSQLFVLNRQGKIISINEDPLFSRYRHACTIHEDILCLVGGVCSSGDNLVFIDTKTWKPSRSYFLPMLDRINHAVVSVLEWIYVIGGVSITTKRPLPHLRLKVIDGEVVVREVFKSLPTLRYHTAITISEARILIVGGLLGDYRFSPNDAILVNTSNECFSHLKLANRESLMLLGAENILVDGLKLSGLGKKRIVCFSMGSHCDSSWSLDLTHLKYLEFVPIFPNYDFESTAPYVIRGHETFKKLGNELNREKVLELLGNRKISVHKCDTPKLKFYPEKNFTFETKEFKQVVKLFEEDKDHWYYYRALSEVNARKYRADFWNDFAEIAGYLDKNAIPIPEDRWHSSILRMSSGRGLCLWTHYDVMSNFLIQIRGWKKVTLWPPSDLPNLYIQGSSSVADLDDQVNYPKLSRCNPVQVMLGPGDVLFIPALWFHHIECVGEEWSLALNVFWRDLPSEAYPKRDLYGNADPTVDPSTLPEPFKSFYLTKLHLGIK